MANLKDWWRRWLVAARADDAADRRAVEVLAEWAFRGAAEADRWEGGDRHRLVVAAAVERAKRLLIR